MSRDNNGQDSGYSSRRRFLTTAGGMATAGLLAGCTGTDGGDGGTDGEDGGDGGTDGGTDGGDGEDGDGSDFPSREIRWIVPYSTGGGFDTYSRGFAEFMPEHLPNDVNIVVENVTGAGGRRGANTVYRADPDGYTIGMWNIPGFVVTQLIQETEYDVNKVSWVGRVASGLYVMMVGADSEYESLEDLQNADNVKFGITGWGGTGSLVNAAAPREMDINAEIVTGYKGAAEVRSALLRGDLDARINALGPALPVLKSGDVRPIVLLENQIPDYVPDNVDMPTLKDVGYGDLAGNFSIHFSVGGPPGIDESRLDILEEAFLAAGQSDEMQEWAQEQERRLNPVGREEIAEIAQNSAEVYNKYKDFLADKMG